MDCFSKSFIIYFLKSIDLPEWTKDPAEFIRWHRSVLESDEVSRHLHSWIDLTFGYKLSGQAAIRNKNVCLDLSENQRELKNRGVLQLFCHPHPTKQLSKPVISRPIVSEPSPYSDAEDESGDERPMERSNVISLPPDFNPSAEIHFLESVHSFLLKSDVRKFKEKEEVEEKAPRHATYLLKVKSMQLLGCLVAELFFPRKFRALGENTDFETRYRNAVDIIVREEKTVPPCVRGILKRLLLRDGSHPFSLENTDRYLAVSDQGLPLPSAELLLDPILEGYFPTIFDPFLQTLSTVETLSHQLEYIEDTDAVDSVSEFQVKLVSRRVSTLLPDCRDETVDLVVPLYRSLVESPRTAVQACWHLLDKISLMMGPERTRETFLDAIISHYKNLYTTKHIKLYHRSFMLVLMTRLRMSVFLDSFSNILIEAVGGNREYTETPVSTPLEPIPPTPIDPTPPTPGEETEPSNTEGEIFSFDSWDTLGYSVKGGIDSSTLASVAHSLNKQACSESIDVHAPVVFAPKDDDTSSLGRRENSVVQISKETLLWLSYRLGPVLTAKHISRNLLRMMSLCFLPPEGLEPTEMFFCDQQIRLSPNMMAGDQIN